MGVTPQYHIHNPDLVSETIEGETVIVDLGTGSYFSLVGAGSIVWTELAAGRSLGEILARLEREFDASPHEIDTAVRELLRELVREGLIDVATTSAADPGSAESVPGDPAPPAPAKRPFPLPHLEKFSDMQEVLLLDPVHDVDPTGRRIPAATRGRTASAQ